MTVILLIPKIIYTKKYNKMNTPLLKFKSIETEPDLPSPYTERPRRKTGYFTQRKQKDNYSSKDSDQMSQNS